jgi:hypothetical protein
MHLTMRVIRELLIRYLYIFIYHFHLTFLSIAHFIPYTTSTYITCNYFISSTLFSLLCALLSLFSILLL